MSTCKNIKVNFNLINKNNFYRVRLDLNKCSDYPDLFKYRQFQGSLITRLDDVLVFDIGKEFEQFIYIPYQWILWMVPDSDQE